VLTEKEARQLTEKIKSNLDNFAALILQARDGKAWKALGYRSFSHW
jgi:hypothetical protein